MACCLLAACSADYEYSTYPCYVVVDNSVFLDPTISTAMNSTAPGTFCMIQQTMSGTVPAFYFQNNQGLSSTQTFTAKETQLSLIFGMNNGVIVGFGNLDSPATFYAYDRECPNCFDPDAIPVKSKPLSMSSNGLATCSVCSRTYDMNNRGYITSEDSGEPLTRYPASTTGPYGVLIVR